MFHLFKLCQKECLAPPVHRDLVQLCHRLRLAQAQYTPNTQRPHQLLTKHASQVWVFRYDFQYPNHQSLGNPFTENVACRPDCHTKFNDRQNTCDANETRLVRTCLNDTISSLIHVFGNTSAQLHADRSWIRATDSLADLINDFLEGV